MGNHRLLKRLFSNAGGVAFRVAICAVSLVVLAAAIVTLLKTFEARRSDDFRRAETISAYGMQEAFSRLAEDFEWNAGFTNEHYPFGEEGQDGVYSVAITREERNDSLYIKIVSVGTVGSVSHTQTEERAVKGGRAAWFDGGEQDDGQYVAPDVEDESAGLSGDSANAVNGDTEQ